MTDRRVLLLCDAAAGVGMGHLMRCLALAQQARRQGWQVRITGDIDAAGQAAAARIAPGIPVARAAAGPLAGLGDGVDVIHVDAYGELSDLRRAGLLVSNMQDGAFGARPADLAIDANLGAERGFRAVPGARARLVGVDAAVVREQVRHQRGLAHEDAEASRVLVVMGGTDPNRLTATVIGALDAIEDSLDVTVVDAAQRDEVRRAAAASSHRVDVVGFVEDLPALAARHDLVISAAGTSVWDFACMGTPMALVCVVDNQREGYREAVSAGLAHGLGLPPHADLRDRIAELGAVLRDRSALSHQRSMLKRAVDGLGVWRIVSTWEQLLDTPVVASPALDGVRARPAGVRDAAVLLAWRNDASTRAHSRTKDPVTEEGHLAWLRRSIDDPHRRLLVVERAGVPVATVRWDEEQDGDWVVSITVAPEQRGRGVAHAALAAGEQTLSAPVPHRLIADIHEANTASRRLFARAGYLPHLPADDDGFARFAKWGFGEGT